MSEPHTQSQRSPATETATTQETTGQATPDREAQQVLADLEQLRSERDKYLELLQRTRADFENYQKRIRRDLEQERRFAAAPLAKDLLPVMDNLERALHAATQDSPLKQGVALVYKQLLEVLRRHGVTPMECVGQTFDPHLHEAVGHVASQEMPEGTIAQVVERGYMLHDRLLKPARVLLACAGSVPSSDGNQNAAEAEDRPDAPAKPRDK